MMPIQCNFGPAVAFSGTDANEEGTHASQGGAERTFGGEPRPNPYSMPGYPDAKRERFRRGEGTTGLDRHGKPTKGAVLHPRFGWRKQLDYPQRLREGDIAPGEEQVMVPTPFGDLRVKRCNSKVQWPIFSFESGKGCSSRGICGFSIESLQKRLHHPGNASLPVTPAEAVAACRSNTAKTQRATRDAAAACGVSTTELGKAKGSGNEPDPVAAQRALNRAGLNPLNILRLIRGLAVKINGKLFQRKAPLTYTYPDFTLCYAQAGEWTYPVTSENNDYQQEVMYNLLESGDEWLIDQAAKAVAAELVRQCDWWSKRSPKAKRWVRFNDTGDVPGGRIHRAAMRFLRVCTEELLKADVRPYLYTKHPENICQALEAIGVIVVRSQKQFIVTGDPDSLPAGAAICGGICHHLICERCPKGETTYILTH